MLDFCSQVTREAENTLREERGVPHVGEGWVAETELFYLIKSAFPDHKVEHHARPQWLGRQHLDIFIHEACVAIEYQGAQHYAPVAYFGGEEAFRLTQQRDKRKLSACQRNGIHLLYVDEGYSVENVIEQIRAIVAANPGAAFT